MLYHMEVDGKPVAIWGSAVLDTKMNAVNPGDLIKVIYLGKGEAKGGHNAPKLYDVYVDYEHRDKQLAEAEGEATPEVPAQVAEAPVPVAPEVQAAPVAQIPAQAPAPVPAPAA